MDAMKYGYARISTGDQNLDLQMDALKGANCDKIFTDTASGTQDEREGLAEAIEALGEGDCLSVWRLDRLGRSLRSLIDVLGQVEAKGAEFESLNEGIDTSTSGGKFYFHMIGAMAQFERDLISERTRAGLESAKARGRTLGRPKKLNGQQIDHARSQIESGDETVRSMARILGVDRKTLSRALATTGS